jgi:predicted membrane channel-forming protein YqfA (hemolysin III family)
MIGVLIYAAAIALALYGVPAATTALIAFATLQLAIVGSFSAVGWHKNMRHNPERDGVFVVLSQQALMVVAVTHLYQSGYIFVAGAISTVLVILALTVTLRVIEQWGHKVK